MKKVLKEIETERKEIISNTIDCRSSDCSFNQTIQIDLRQSPVWDAGNLKLFVEVEEPETIKEFIEQKEITKSELLEWLNENYK